MPPDHEGDRFSLSCPICLKRPLCLILKVWCVEGRLFSHFLQFALVILILPLYNGS
jgi:hypothetical protein